MENNGWIKLHRRIMNNPDWLAEPFTRAQAWIDLLLLANHDTGHIRKRGILIEVKRGQVGYSEEALAQRWRWSRGKVRRFFRDLIEKSQISRNPVQQNSRLISLITITNYDIYQSHSTTNGTTNRQQTVQEQEEKEEKEKYSVELYNFYLSEIQPEFKSKKRALSNIAYYLKSYLHDELKMAISNYKSVCRNREPQYKKDPANFFGKREKPFVDFLPENFSLDDKPTGQESTGSALLDVYYANRN